VNGEEESVRVPKLFTTLTQSMSLLVFTVRVSTVPLLANAGLNVDELMFAAEARDARTIGAVRTAAPIRDAVRNRPT
jgi:hypothetical protein